MEYRRLVNIKACVKKAITCDHNGIQWHVNMGTIKSARFYIALAK